MLVSSWAVRMASINAKGHHHEWQSKPLDGKLEWSKTWDERYWDEEELAANFMYSSPAPLSNFAFSVLISVRTLGTRS